MNKHLILSTTDKNHSIQQEKVTVTGNASSFITIFKGLESVTVMACGA